MTAKKVDTITLYRAKKDIVTIHSPEGEKLGKRVLWKDKRKKGTFYVHHNGLRECDNKGWIYFKENARRW